MKSISLGLAAGLFSAAAAAAAPFDCTRQAQGSTDVTLRYEAERIDRIVDLNVFSFGAFPAECAIDGSGRINAVSGRGSVRLDNGERYEVTVRGDLGTAFFDTDFPEFGGRSFDSAVRPPQHRLDFRPLGGRDLDFLYPNGFSVALNCSAPEPDDFPFGRCNPDDDAEIFFLIDVRDGEVFGITSDSSGSYVLGAVPLPAGLPLAAGALGLLGWVARKRRG